MAPKTKGTKRSSGGASPLKAKQARSAADPEMASVLEAISMAVELNEDCRGMLGAALPHALGVTKEERIAPQTQMVDMVEEAMSSVEASLVAASENAAAQLKEVNDSKGQLSEKKDAAEATLNEAGAVLTSKTEALAAADAELKAAKATAHETDKEQKSVEKDFEKTNKDLSAYESLMSGEFKTLSDGTWEKKADANKMCKHLEQLAATLSLESSLTTALPGVFTKKPDERGAFEKIVVETLEKHLREHIVKLSKMVADWPTVVSERAAAADAATKALEAATEAKNAAQEAVAGAKASKATATKDLKDAEHKAKNFFPNLEAAAKHQDATQAALEKFRSQNMQAFTTLKEKVAMEAEEAAPPAEEAAPPAEEAEQPVAEA